MIPLLDLLEWRSIVGAGESCPGNPRPSQAHTLDGMLLILGDGNNHSVWAILAEIHPSFLCCLNCEKRLCVSAPPRPPSQCRQSLNEPLTIPRLLVGLAPPHRANCPAAYQPGHGRLF